MLRRIRCDKIGYDLLIVDGLCKVSKSLRKFLGVSELGIPSREQLAAFFIAYLSGSDAKDSLFLIPIFSVVLIRF
jgi:hypothetical protein